MSKIARLKLKLNKDIDIYDVLIAYTLRKMADKLYLYIDDRNHNYNNYSHYKNNNNKYYNDDTVHKDENSNLLEKKLQLLKKFNIDYDLIIK
jgi:hypothetical protein